MRWERQPWGLIPGPHTRSIYSAARRRGHEEGSGVPDRWSEVAWYSTLEVWASHRDPHGVDALISTGAEPCHELYHVCLPTPRTSLQASVKGQRKHSYPGDRLIMNVCSNAHDHVCRCFEQSWQYYALV